MDLWFAGGLCSEHSKRSRWRWREQRNEYSGMECGGNSFGWIVLFVSWYRTSSMLSVSRRAIQDRNLFVLSRLFARLSRKVYELRIIGRRNLAYCSQCTSP